MIILTSRYKVGPMDLELVNEFTLSTPGTVSSLRWLSKGRNSQFVYASSNGECMLRSAESKTSEIVRINNKEEFLALDIDHRSQSIAIAEKHGQANFGVNRRSSSIAWETRIWKKED